MEVGWMGMAVGSLWAWEAVGGHDIGKAPRLLLLWRRCFDIGDGGLEVSAGMFWWGSAGRQSERGRAPLCGIGGTVDVRKTMALSRSRNGLK